MMLTFEWIDRMAISALKEKKTFHFSAPSLRKEEKVRTSALISNSNIEREKRDEMIMFYRLTILVVGILDKIGTVGLRDKR